MSTELTQPEPSPHEAAADYARGPLGLLPGVVLLLVVRVYSALGEWGSGQVLALGLGMTGSMLITGGFVQAVSRRGSIYLGLGNRPAAYLYLRVITRWALVSVIALAVLAVLLLAALNLFTPGERVTFGLAFAGVGTIWLMSAGLILIQAPAWLGAALVLGLVAGIAADQAAALFSRLHLAAGAAIGFAVTAGVISYAVDRGMNRQAGKAAGTLPSIRYMAYEAAPYLTYGALYTLLILLPHLLGWLGALAPHQERLRAMNSVEIGLTLALVPMMLASGVSERTLRLFWRQAKRVQAAISGYEHRQFGQALIRFYHQQLQIYLAALAGSTCIGDLLFESALRTGLLDRWLQLSDPDMAAVLFREALIAYGLLGWGAFNCMFALSLGRPRQPLRAVLLGLVGMVVVGIPLCLGVSFSYAALVFFAGTLVFAWASSQSTLRLLESADYYYFSAF